MNWLKRIFNRPDKSIQEENRNKLALECLRELCFEQVDIRKAIVILNRIRPKELAKSDGVSAVAIYNTLKGRRANKRAMELLAERLDVSVADLFPEKANEAGPPAAV